MLVESIPLSQLISANKFTLLSTAFFCGKHNLHAYLTSVSPNSPFKLPEPLVDSLISKTAFWYGGLLSGLSLLIEERRRRGELAMYVLPKGLESAWIAARGHGFLPKTGNYGDALVSNDLLILFIADCP